MSLFLRGMAYAVRGAVYLIRHPGLFLWALAPFVLTLLLFGAGALVLRGQLRGWVDALAFSSSFTTVLVVLVWAAYLLAAMLVLLPLAGLLSGPFLENLSEAVESRVTGTSPAPWSLRRMGRDLLLSIGQAPRRLLGYFALLGGLFLASVFLPGIGILISLAGSLYAASCYAAWDALDTVLARRGWSYAQKKDFLVKHRGLSLGLGAATALIMAVPILGALALSVGAVGATLLVLEVEGRNLF